MLFPLLFTLLRSLVQQWTCYLIMRTVYRAWTWYPSDDRPWHETLNHGNLDPPCVDIVAWTWSCSTKSIDRISLKERELLKGRKSRKGVIAIFCIENSQSPVFESRIVHGYSGKVKPRFCSCLMTQPGMTRLTTRYREAILPLEKSAQEKGNKTGSRKYVTSYETCCVCFSFS